MLDFEIKFSDDDMDKLMGDISSPVSESLNSLSLSLPTYEEIDANTVLLYDSPLLTLNSRRVCSIGNGLMFIAPQKTGKSQSCEAIASSVINPDCDTLGFKFHPVDERGALYVDTERTRNDAKKGFERIQRRTGVDPNENGKYDKVTFLSLAYCLDIHHGRTIIEEYLAKGLYSLLILDGASDFVNSENDQEESKGFVRWLFYISAKYAIGYVVTIHPNTMDQQGKGTCHLGTILAKKCEGILNMYKPDGDPSCRIITTESLQGGLRNDASDITQYIYYDTDKWMFLSLPEYGSRLKLEPWREALREREMMLIDEFVKFVWHSHNGTKNLSWCKRFLAEMIELGELVDISGKIMLPDKKYLLSGQEPVPGDDQRGEVYDPNYFPKEIDQNEEEPF
jgi:hypothetical protein